MISVFTILILTLIVIGKTSSNTNTTIATQFADKDGGSTVKVLSRRKRFLIFPDGSSFQIVFCTQNHGYLQIGNIVWFGTTAALAWELPTDPGDFDMFRDSYKALGAKRRSDVLYYVDEDGKVVDKIEYKRYAYKDDHDLFVHWFKNRDKTQMKLKLSRKILINPAFAKRSVDAAENNNRKVTKLNKKAMHNSQRNKIVFKDFDTTKLEILRKERQKLYAKLEKFLQTLGWNGKECILRMLCETGKDTTEQESFVGEIIRAVFTLPEVPDSVSELHKQYDDAHGSNGNCSQLYPKCGHIPVL